MRGVTVKIGIRRKTGLARKCGAGSIRLKGRELGGKFKPAPLREDRGDNKASPGSGVGREGF